MGILWNKKRIKKLEKKIPDSILLIQTAFIGDVILATALVEAIKLTFPTSTVDILVRKGNESLFQDDERIRQVISFDKKNKYRNLVSLILSIRKERYDLLINLQRFATTGILTTFSGASFTIGFDKNPFSRFFSKTVKHQISEKNVQIHEVDRNHQLISSFSDTPPTKPKLIISQNTLHSVSGYKNGRYLCIAPASVWVTKQFPVEKWIMLIDSIPESIKIFLLGAPSEKKFTEEILTGSRHPNVLNLAGELSLLQSAALMKDAVLVYTNDSAPMHLASAVNAPVCAIYCSTVPAFGFGPLSDFSRVAEVKEPLYCRPCGLHGYKSCPEGHFRCAIDIQNEQLLDSWKEALAIKSI